MTAPNHAESPPQTDYHALEEEDRNGSSSSSAAAADETAQQQCHSSSEYHSLDEGTGGSSPTHVADENVFARRHSSLPPTALPTIKEEKDNNTSTSSCSPCSSLMKSLWIEIWDLIPELIHFMKNRNWKKKLLTVLIVGTSAFVFLDLIFFGRITGNLNKFLEWMNRYSVVALFAYLGMFILTTLAFVPPAILTFGAGFVYAEVYGLYVGIVIATWASFIGAVIGAVLAFFRARYMMRDLVQLFAKRYPLVRAADRALHRNGFRVMLLLRLCPLIPFNALNYIGGVTEIKWESFTLALIGILPGQLLTVAVGATAGSLAGGKDGNDEHQLLRIILVSMGIGFGIIAILITAHFARLELKKELEEAERKASVNTTLQKAEMGSGGSATTGGGKKEGHRDNSLAKYKQGSVASQLGLEVLYVEQKEEEVNDEEWFWIWT